MSEEMDAGTTTKIQVNPEDVPYCFKCGDYHFFFDCEYQDSASNEVGRLSRR